MNIDSSPQVATSPTSTTAPCHNRQHIAQLASALYCMRTHTIAPNQHHGVDARRQPRWLPRTADLHWVILLRGRRRFQGCTPTACAL
jgi:hypothetical protein